MKNKQNIKEMWDTIKHINKHRVPKEEKSVRKERKILMAENFPNLLKNNNLYI